MTLLSNWVLIMAGAVLILAEVALGGFAGFDLVLIGSSLLIGGALGLWFGSVAVGFIAASVLCLAYVALGRRYVRRRIHVSPIRSNADAVIGREAVVIARIAPHEPGQVKVNDEIWRAAIAPGAAEALEPGRRVVVSAIDGVTLHVR